jgi:hypothetical protein
VLVTGFFAANSLCQQAQIFSGIGRRFFSNPKIDAVKGGEKMPSSTDYAANGVKTVPVLPSPGDVVQIVYDGLLAKSGATEVYAHIGFDEEWDQVRDLQMMKTPEGFQTSVDPPHSATTLNICFRDPANNWDNNSGRNYSIDLRSITAAFAWSSQEAAWHSAEFAAEPAGFAFAYRPRRVASPHGVRGRSLAAARQVGWSRRVPS